MSGRRDRLLWVAAATLTAAALAAPGAAAAPSWDAHCGSQPRAEGAGWYHVRAENTPCRVARRVARHVWRTGETAFDGWRCRRGPRGGGPRYVDCFRTHRGVRQRVRFDLAP